MTAPYIFVYGHTPFPQLPAYEPSASFCASQEMKAPPRKRFMSSTIYSRSCGKRGKGKRVTLRTHCTGN